MPPRRQSDSPPEAELLLSVGRAADEDAAARIRQLLQAGLNTPQLLELAHRHGVEPLLHQTLQRQPAGAAPDELLEPLRRRHREVVMRNLFLAGELVRLVERFREARLPVIPYKGPLLAIAAYGDLSLRRFLDLDLLVREEDFDRACRLLSDLGYRRSLAAPHDAAYIASLGQLPLMRDDGRCLVELHARLGMRGFPYRASFDDLAGRLEGVVVGDRCVTTLKAEDLLLYLCVHGAKHVWNRLAWICDVAALLRARPDLDWDHIAREAERLHCRRMLGLGLYLPHALFDSPWSWGIQPVEPAAPSLAAQVRRNLFLPRRPGAGANAIFHLQTRDRWRDRLDCAWSLIANPTPADWNDSRIPSQWRLVHTALRPLRLTAKRLTAWRR